MKLKPIITSLLDTDLYKFNMNQVIFHKHTDLVGEYHFKCRTPNIFFYKRNGYGNKRSNWLFVQFYGLKMKN